MAHTAVCVTLQLNYRSSHRFILQTGRYFTSICSAHPDNLAPSTVTRLSSRAVHKFAKCRPWTFTSISRRLFCQNKHHICTSSRHLSSSVQQLDQCLVSETDRFNARLVNLSDSGNAVFTEDVGRFANALADSTAVWKTEGAIAVWLRVPIMQSGLIPVAACQGFELHHTDGDTVVLSKWLLHCASRLPSYANHQIGVSGFVLNEEKQEVLMIQDKHRIARWKFPGGLSDFREDIPNTACREVLEETGIQTEFQSILCFRQQHNMPFAFGISDIYVVCRLRPLNFDFNICKDELVEAKWMKVREVLESPDHTHLSVRVAKLVQHGLQNGFDQVDITMDELPSVYKNTTYKLFHKPLPSL